MYKPIASLWYFKPHTNLYFFHFHYPCIQSQMYTKCQKERRKKICRFKFVSNTKSSSDFNICFVWQYHEIDYGNVSLISKIMNGLLSLWFWWWWVGKIFLKIRNQCHNLSKSFVQVQELDLKTNNSLISHGN